jgi:hypothetical protein
MEGQVVGVQVEYLIENSDGPQRVMVNLESIRTHCRPERVDDLIDDLVLLCQDVRAKRYPCDRDRGPSLPPNRSLRRIK